MGQYTLHKAASRGHVDLGWLDSHHSFSFGEYYNPDRLRFGLLRVLNDDVVKGGKGFGTHPHDNMEIISIPLYGDLQHKDSMQNTSVIRAGDVQLMSAGTGILHSEYNPNPEADVNFLQIWIFPEKRNIAPRYDQKTFSTADREDQIQLLVSPLDDASPVIHINQRAWISMARVNPGKPLSYRRHDAENGVYFFLLSGTLKVDDKDMHRRDGLGVTGKEEMSITAAEASEVLIIEVPMSSPVLK